MKKTMLLTTCAILFLASQKLSCMIKNPIEQIPKDPSCLSEIIEKAKNIDYKNLWKWLNEPVPKLRKKCLWKLFVLEPCFEICNLIADPKKYLKKHD